MNSIVKLFDDVAGFFKDDEEEETCQIKETIDDFLDIVKEKLGRIGDISCAPLLLTRSRKTPNFTGFDIREKISSSPYYKGQLHKLLQNKPSFCKSLGDILAGKGSAAKRTQEERSKIRNYLRQKYCVDNLQCNMK